MLTRCWRHERESLLQEDEHDKHHDESSVEVCTGGWLERKLSFLTIRSTEEKCMGARLVEEAGFLLEE